MSHNPHLPTGEFLDPVPWLLRQHGIRAVRARRVTGLSVEGDDEIIASHISDLECSQCADGSVAGSVLGTAAVLLQLCDVGVPQKSPMVKRAGAFLLHSLMAQPGYERAAHLRPGELDEPCDLCGFFGPYHDRAIPHVMAVGAEEMNALRDVDPLVGPRTPVKSSASSPRARVGPGSCYAWGLLPLAYVCEALFRGGWDGDERLMPALNVLLAAQRPSGGWCRNLVGHAKCTLFGLRALAAHPTLRASASGDAAIAFVAASHGRYHTHAYLQALSSFQQESAKEAIEHLLAVVLPRQRANGSFPPPCPIERTAAVLLAARAVGLA